VRNRATERELVVVAAVLEAGSEKAAAHRLGLSHSTVKHHLANARSKVGATTTAQLVWILAPRLAEPDGQAQPDEQRLPRRSREAAGLAAVRAPQLVRPRRRMLSGPGGGSRSRLSRPE
jgi:DNA-binding CsgD family transcriptional regulator